MEAIHYISDFTYLSGKKLGKKYSSIEDVIKHHIRYITRNVEGVYAFNIDMNEWINRTREEIKKRWDSRVALKFVMALPLETDKENVEEYANLLQNFISEKLDVDKKNISIAIHLHKGIGGNYNPHAHVLIYPRNRQGKKLRLNKKDLSNFHREWQKKLLELGYKIKKDEDPIPHLGKKLYYDKDAQELYKVSMEIKKLKKELNLHVHRGRAGALGREREEEMKIEENSPLNVIRNFLAGKDEDFRNKQKRALVFHFRNLGYSLDDKIALVLVNHKESKVLQRIFTVREILSDKILRFLSAKNSEGYSVYFSVNTLKKNAKRRRKEDFNKKQKRIYLDADSKTKKGKELIEMIYQYMKLKQLPAPTHIVKSSKGNYQFYWTLKKEEDYELLERIMEKLSIDLELDHTQDVSRVFRLPYFRNKKPGKDDLVVNIKKLNVFLKDRKIGEIEATGEPVDIEPFLELLKEPEFKQTKELEISKEIEEFFWKFDREIERYKRKRKEEEKRRKEEEERRRREREKVEKEEMLRKYRERGYSEKVAEYFYFFEKEIFPTLNNDFLEKVIRGAFERNKAKSPSEVDLGMLATLYILDNGKPLRSDLEAILDVIFEGAKKRGKYDPYDYVERTLRTVERAFNIDTTDDLDIDV